MLRLYKITEYALQLRYTDLILHNSVLTFCDFFLFYKTRNIKMGKRISVGTQTMTCFEEKNITFIDSRQQRTFIFYPPWIKVFLLLLVMMMMGLFV